jgi:AbrB family looped-hinge helix DNA binding protein
MVYTVSITSQGQISIPAAIRTKLGLNKYKKALIIEDGSGGVNVKPIRDFMELKGSLKTNKRPLTSEEIHELFAEEVAREYSSKLNDSKK